MVIHVSRALHLGLSNYLAEVLKQFAGLRSAAQTTFTWARPSRARKSPGIIYFTCVIRNDSSVHCDSSEPEANGGRMSRHTGGVS